MFGNIENLKIEEIYKGVAKRQGRITFRNNNSFVFRISGSMKYVFDDCSLALNSGEIIFLPKGISYDYFALTDTPCEYIIIKVDGEITEATPGICSLENFQEIEELKNSLPDLWKFGSQADRYKCYSVFYNLLSYIEYHENMSYKDKKKFEIIEPAVSYLKNHIYDSELKAEKLHQLCGISGAYFRKIFQLNYAVSPQKYILSKRLSHAKNLINNGDFDTIGEVALAVGYTDPLYFSRAFRKKYGVSPSEYAKG